MLIIKNSDFVFLTYCCRLEEIPSTERGKFYYFRDRTIGEVLRKE